MNAGTAYGGSFQLDRVENGNRVDKPGPGRTPFYLAQYRFRFLIFPFKSNGIPRELCCGAQSFPISNIIINENQTIGREIIFCNFSCKTFHGLKNRILCYHLIRHHIKTETGKPAHIFLNGINGFPTVGVNHGKGKKENISFCCYFIV